MPCGEVALFTCLPRKRETRTLKPEDPNSQPKKPIKLHQTLHPYTNIRNRNKQAPKTRTAESFHGFGFESCKFRALGLCNVRTSDGEGPWVSAFPISSSLQLLQTTGKTNRSFFQATVGACYTTLIGGDDDDDDDSGGHRPKVCSFSIQPGSLPPGRPSGGGHSYEETCHTSE